MLNKYSSALARKYTRLMIHSPEESLNWDLIDLYEIDHVHRTFALQLKDIILLLAVMVF